jgi:hypothetical protein
MFFGLGGLAGEIEVNVFGGGFDFAKADLVGGFGVVDIEVGDLIAERIGGEILIEVFVEMNADVIEFCVFLLD